MSDRLFGKFRGVVADNDDPLRTGRIRAIVPSVSASALNSWAVPCVPATLLPKRGSALPKVGDLVWIEFEEGDPNYPIWSGCFFGSAEDEPDSLKHGYCETRHSHVPVITACPLESHRSPASPYSGRGSRKAHSH